MGPDGRVLAYQYGTWGTVCGNQWDDADAAVVCRSLGYSGGHALHLSRDYNHSRTLYNVACSGWESELRHCPSSTWDVNGTCYYSGDAGVSCNQYLHDGEGRWSTRLGSSPSLSSSCGAQGVSSSPSQRRWRRLELSPLIAVSLDTADLPCPLNPQGICHVVADICSQVHSVLFTLSEGWC